MKTINISESEIKLQSVLNELEKDKEVIVIYRNGRPIADLVPHTQKRRIEPHPLMSKIEINYNPTEILSQDEWSEDD